MTNIESRLLDTVTGGAGNDDAPLTVGILRELCTKLDSQAGKAAGRRDTEVSEALDRVANACWLALPSK